MEIGDTTLRVEVHANHTPSLTIGPQYLVHFAIQLFDLAVRLYGENRLGVEHDGICLVVVRRKRRTSLRMDP